MISTKCLTDLSDITEKKTEFKVQLAWKDHFSNMNYFIKFLSDSTTGQPELTKIYHSQPEALKYSLYRYELLWITHKEINSDISQMFHRFKWYCRKEDWA